MKDLNQKLIDLKVLFLDADGVFFDGQEQLGNIDGKIVVFKSRSYQDGQGISFLRSLGIKIIFISGEEEPLRSIIEKVNSLPSVKEGKWSPIEFFTNKKINKLQTMQNWLKENKMNLVESAYMGDDMNDLECLKVMQKEGLSICPQNATRPIKKVSDVITQKSGGHGAIRELVEKILDARNINEESLSVA